MLNTDAQDVYDRINGVIKEIEGDFIVGDKDIIKGLNVVLDANNKVNPEVMDDESLNLIEREIHSYESKYEENMVPVPGYIRKGIYHGEMIVNAVHMKHTKVYKKNR